MTRRIILVLTLLLASGLSAQQPEVVGARFLESRAELESLLEELRLAAESTAYSSTLRRRARDEATVIERRLQEGDYGVNDRIYLEVTVQGQSWFADTLRVVAGPAVRFPELGPVGLQGVLRSELAEHLTVELSRFLREPQIDAAESFIRLTVLGAVGVQGERYASAEATLGTVLTESGLGESSDFEGATIARGGETLWDDDAVAEAIRRGRTLDQLSLQAGDEIQIPAQRDASRWLTWLQLGIGVATAISVIIWRF